MALCAGPETETLHCNVSGPRPHEYTELSREEKRGHAQPASDRERTTGEAPCAEAVMQSKLPSCSKSSTAEFQRKTAQPVGLQRTLPCWSLDFCTLLTQGTAIVPRANPL